MKVCVTGGAGYIGDAAVKNLLDQKHYVTILDNLMYGGMYIRQHPKLKFVCGDITDVNLLRELVPQHDAILHLAAIVGDGACAADPERTIAVNLDATVKIAELCVLYNKQLTFASTCSVYGASNEYLTEDSPTNPLSLYAGTKLKAEEFVREVPHHYIFRLGTLFGLSTEHARFRSDLIVNILTLKAVMGQKLTVFGGEQYRPLLHVRDAGELMSTSCVRKISPFAKGKDTYGTYILARQNSTILEIAQIIASVCNIPFREIEITELPFEDQRNYRVSSSRRGNYWLTRIPLSIGVYEIAQVAKEGRIADVWNKAYHNAKYIEEGV